MKYRIDAEIVKDDEVQGYIAIFAEGDDISEALIDGEDQLKTIVPVDKGLKCQIMSICEDVCEE